MSPSARSSPDDSEQHDRRQPAGGRGQLGAVRGLPVLSRQLPAAFRRRLRPIFGHDMFLGQKGKRVPRACRA